MRAYLPIARATYMIGIVYRFGFLFTILGNIVYHYGELIGKQAVLAMYNKITFGFAGVVLRTLN